MTTDQIITIIVAVMGGSALTQFVLLPLTRKKMIQEIGASDAAKLQAMANAGLSSLKEALSQAEQGAKDYRQESRQAWREARSAREELHAAREEIENIKYEAMITTQQLRRLREAIIQPGMTMDILRTMVRSGPTSGSENGH